MDVKDGTSWSELAWSEFPVLSEELSVHLPLPPHPSSSPLPPHPSLLTLPPHPSPLTLPPHPSPLTPPPSPLPPHPSPLTPTLSPLPPHPSLLTPPPSPLPPHPSSSPLLLTPPSSPLLLTPPYPFPPPVILGNAYFSLFFMTSSDPKLLKQSMSAYTQAVRPTVPPFSTT